VRGARLCGVVAYTRGTHDSPARSFPISTTVTMRERSSNGLPSNPGVTAAWQCTAMPTAAYLVGGRQATAARAQSHRDIGNHRSGIDVPMGGNIFQNSAYRWSSYVTNTKTSDESGYYDDALWHALDQKWYVSGSRYRDMGRLYGKPNPIFIRLAESTRATTGTGRRWSLTGTVRTHQYSGADDDGLLFRKRIGRPVLFHAASSIRPACRPYAGHRSLR